MRRALYACVVGAVLAAASSAMAGIQTVLFDPGTTNTTAALTGFSTTGSMMDGMKIHVLYTDTTTEDLLWATTGPGAGAASGVSFSLRESGDTFGAAWTLTTSKSLDSVLIDAGPGNSVLDTDFGGLEGTPGSASGWTFQWTGWNGGGIGAAPFNIVATYHDEVAVGAALPVGDLYRSISLSFAQSMGAGNITFIQDTDNLLFAGDITPVPLPPAVWMGMSVLLGSGGVAMLRRRLARR